MRFKHLLIALLGSFFLFTIIFHRHFVHEDNIIVKKQSSNNKRVFAVHIHAFNSSVKSNDNHHNKDWVDFKFNLISLSSKFLSVRNILNKDLYNKIFLRRWTNKGPPASLT